MAEVWKELPCLRIFEFVVGRVLAAPLLVCDLEYLEFEGELCEVVVCLIFMIAVSSFSVAERGLPLELATRLTPLFLWQRSGANFTSLICFKPYGKTMESFQYFRSNYSKSEV